MATRKELRAEIAEARAILHRAIVESAGSWETPGLGAEGEEAWSARQALEHCVGAEVFFASAISEACGYPALELSRQSLATAADAAEQLSRASAKADGVLQYVTDEDLAKQVAEGQRLAGMSVEQIMALAAHHARDHAQQALTAAGREPATAV
ncbi:MAG TPA: DinB family protein [Dehalococcoidia bacterium]|nr:DinB family protein [Dehalococcoidia bacterium]